MSSKRLYLTFLSAWFAGATLGTATDFITVGKDRVHPTRILAKYKDHAALQTRTLALRDLGLIESRRYWLTPGLVLLDEGNQPALAELQTPAVQKDRLLERITALRNSGLFEYVEADNVVSVSLAPTDRAFADGTLWGLMNYGQNGGVAGADIGVTNAWDITTGSTNVIVAVLDTGIRYTHRDLATQMWRNPNEIAGNSIDDDGNGYIDDVFGINVITGSGNPLDDNNHGTHVAGTIGAAANDGNPHVGVAWKVRLMACKFEGADGLGFTGDAITCIDYAIAKGAKIINISWGSSVYNQALFDSISNARARQVLFVAGAGNDSNDIDSNPMYPASYQLDNIIAVAALDRSDRLASFSNYGHNSVDLGAPGVAIYSSTAGSDTDYDVYQGTSMAAPHVTGVAALIAARSTNATIAEMRARLLTTTVPVADLRDKSVTGGRVNAYRALTAASDRNLEVYVDPPDGSDILAGSSTPVFVTVNDLYGVTNATVTGSYTGSTNIAFVNTGRAPDQLANDNIYSALLQVPTNAGSLNLRLAISAPAKNATNVTVTYRIVLRPANDDFANAAKIPALGAFGDNTIVATNKFATLERNEPAHAGVSSVRASLWWTWTPTFPGDVLVDTTGSSFDTVVAVYAGDSLTSLREIASADDSGGRRQGYLHFVADGDTTYRIVIAGHDLNQVGTVRLRVEPGGQADTVAPLVVIDYPPSGLMLTNALDRRIVVRGTAYDPMPYGSGIKEVVVAATGGVGSPATGLTNWTWTNQLQYGVNTITAEASDFAGNISQKKTVQVIYRPPDPINDIFLAAIELQGSSGSVVATNINATKELGEPKHAGNQGGKSVWWFLQAPSDGVLALNTTNSTFDTLLAVYTGDRVNNLTLIASNDDAYNGATYSKLTQAVRGNHVYHIAADGYGGSSGTLTLNYSFTPASIVSLTVTSPNGRVSPGSGLYGVDSTVNLYATPDPGYEFAGWAGDVKSYLNPLTVVMTTDLTLTAQFVLHVPTDDFETGNLTKLPWTTSGGAPWIVQNAVVSKGTYAARSGVITNLEQSILTLEVATPSGVGTFDYKVSSEPFWDRLEFLLNGVVQQVWSGEVDWNKYGFLLPAGTNRLEWRYSKDVFFSEGLDAAFIDNLELPTQQPEAGSSVTILSANLERAGFRIQLQGLLDQQYVIEASSDLVNWKPIRTAVATNGVLVVVDPDVGSAERRFYRAVIR
jgi:subtilisin family serine protease